MRHIRGLLSLLGLSLGSNAVAADVVVGRAHLPIPAGWSVADRSPERATLHDDQWTQSITLSSLAFQVSPSFDDFKRICQLRLEAERKDAPHVFIEADEPTVTSDSAFFFFSGADKSSRRVFSGELTLVKNELITVYLEGMNVDPKEHLAFFAKTVKSLSVAGQSPNAWLQRTHDR